VECIINDLPIYYEEYGEGKPVLCLHRFTEDHRMMKGCLEPFFAGTKGYRRIYLDMPGMGKTPAIDWIKNADIMLDILKKFVAEAIGDEEFLLIAASYGVYVSLGMVYVGGMNISGMFLFNPCTVADSKKRRLPEGAKIFKEDCLEEFIDGEGVENSNYFFEDAVVQTRETWIRFKTDILPAYQLADYDFCENYRKNGYSFTFDSGPAILKTNHNNYGTTG